MARFDQEHATSDGGAVLLKAIDEKLGLSGAPPGVHICLVAGVTDMRKGFDGLC